MRINIVRLGNVDLKIVGWLERSLSECFDCEINVVRHSLSLPEECYDSFRGQYVGDLLLRYLAIVDSRFNFEGRVLGVADVDAYSNGLNFIFGIADFNGKYALIFLPRLRPEFYMLPSREWSFEECVLKEALHELGHTFGLNHCLNPDCVMFFSNSIYDTLRKKAAYCMKCAKRIRRNWGIRVSCILE